MFAVCWRLCTYRLCRCVWHEHDGPENKRVVTADSPGMRLKTGDIAVSLGTSDTLFLSLRQPKLILEGHILSSPIDKDGYMALLCFKNGSLTRERIRDSCVEGSWKLFNELLNSTPRGNFGNMGVYYDIQEIIPSVKGDYRVNKANVQLSKFNSKEIEVRALIEGQFLGKRAYAEDLGVSLGENTRIFATGGASNNSAILQVLADVFNSPVYTLVSFQKEVIHILTCITYFLDFHDVMCAC
ncbi:hypothetical protein B7P43_G00701 [Cryptotermes secundus]|uniref:Carbohydrate kinase FGGY C-terminal domain-containing protein n=1 Tax=Cryptotermes secundus TaxID=105785 RepID=A0A2J7QUB4_9NEOP|nr:hypothetical protein B7P43_G00701 [Cryptotermes secundus]